MSENAARVIAGLVSRGLPQHIAQGIAANMMAESRLDPGINEIAPLVKGSRGGFGLNQWTGPRRRALEAAARARGVPVNDLDFQIDYTLEELNGPERRAWNALQGAPDAETAARIYSEKFLRPGIPHLENRLRLAREFSGLPMDNTQQAPAMAEYMPPPANALAAPPQPDPRENALALMDQFRHRYTPLDPQMFSRGRT